MKAAAFLTSMVWTGCRSWPSLVVTDAFQPSSHHRTRASSSSTTTPFWGTTNVHEQLLRSPRHELESQRRPHQLVSIHPTCDSRSSSTRKATALQAQSSSTTTTKGGASIPEQQLDVDAMIKYAVAIATQMGLFYAIFQGADLALRSVTLPSSQVLFAVNCVVFWMCSLKSRVLNPLNNSRPTTDNDLELAEYSTETRVRPSWTPPGPVFPLVQILFIAPIRAATTAMIYETTGSYATTAFLALALHLSIGDVWNTVNNVERRYGAAVIGVAIVWLSNAWAAYQYYQVLPQAGQLLCLPLLWFTVAGALITDTWRLNPDPQTGELYPLYPVRGQGSTAFDWFQKD